MCIMLYPYNNHQREYSKEISMFFGLLSILFSLLIPPTGFIMGSIGLWYEKKSAKDNDEKYSYLNISLNSIGVLIAALYLIYFALFRLNIF